MNYEELKTMLLNAGMCKDYDGMWVEDISAESVVGNSLTLDGIDFLTASKAVMPEYIKTNFSQYINGATVIFGGRFSGKLYVDFTGSIEGNTDTINIMGRSMVDMQIKRLKSVFVSISDNSFVSTSLIEDNYCRINVHDNSVLYINSVHPDSMALITLYGNAQLIYASSCVVPERTVKIRRLPKMTVGSLTQRRYGK